MPFLRRERPADNDAWKDLHQPFAFIAKNSSELAERLEYIRESRTYRTRLGLTWAKFCVEYAGISRSHADSLIRRREVFGENYFRLINQVSISPKTYRKIASHVSDEGLEIDGRKVAIKYENSDELAAIVRRLRSRLRQSRKGPLRATEYCSVPLP